MNKRKQISKKLGLLFIISLLSLMTISMSYSHWQENLEIKSTMMTTNWDDTCPEIIIAYEDSTITFDDMVLFTSIDYDYNDFVVKVSVSGFYIDDSLIRLNFTFEAIARSAINNHSFYLRIPSGTFATNGRYTMIQYDTNGFPLKTISSPFYDSEDIDICIFPDIWEALPSKNDSEFCVNTINGTGICPGRMTTVSFNYTGVFCKNNINIRSVESIDVHGDNLFFDPYLDIKDSDEYIHYGNSCLIFVPTSWIWPKEIEKGRGVPIWDVYLYNTTRDEGITMGNPPFFTPNWYNEPPTELKWTP